MSNIATRPIEPAHAHSVTVSADTFRTLLLIAVLALIWISLEPFSAGGLSESGETSFERSGQLINQLGYTLTGLIVFTTVLATVDRRVLGAFISPAWVIMAVIVALSAVFGEASGAWRSVAFSLIATGIAASVPLLAPTRQDFDFALKVVALTVLGLCYAGLVLAPASAIHQAYDLEAQHAGLWRGLFTHKNIAAPVMVMIAFAGFYLLREGHRIGGTLIVVLATLFVFNAGSKTSLGLMPIAALIVLVPAWVGARSLAALIAIAAIAGAHALTIGTVFVPAFDAVLRTFSENTTFTGRISIWEFAGDYVMQHPWTGFGYDGFWRTPLLLATEQPFDRAWDPRGIIHGHNGFIDVALFFGLPGLFMMIWITVFGPAIDYVRAARKPANGPLADMFFMMIVFCVLVSALESFYFRRSDPIWLTMVIALSGLHLAGRLPLRNG